MSITHCPLCVGLAVLSAVQFMAHAVIVWAVTVKPTDGLLQQLQPATARG